MAQFCDIISGYCHVKFMKPGLHNTVREHIWHKSEVALHIPLSTFCCWVWHTYCLTLHCKWPIYPFLHQATNKATPKHVFFCHRFWKNNYIQNVSMPQDGSDVSINVQVVQVFFHFTWEYIANIACESIRCVYVCWGDAGVGLHAG